MQHRMHRSTAPSHRPASSMLRTTFRSPVSACLRSAGQGRRFDAGDADDAISVAQLAMLGLRFSSSIRCCFRTASHCGCDLNSALAHWLTMHCAMAMKLRPAHSVCGAAGGGGGGSGAGTGAASAAVGAGATTTGVAAAFFGLLDAVAAVGRVATGCGAAAGGVAAAAAADGGTAAAGTFVPVVSGTGAGVGVGVGVGAGAGIGVDVGATATGDGSTEPVAAGAFAGGATASGTSDVPLRPANQYQAAPASNAISSMAIPMPRPLEDLGSGNVSSASG